MRCASTESFHECQFFQLKQEAGFLKLCGQCPFVWCLVLLLFTDVGFFSLLLPNLFVSKLICKSVLVRPIKPDIYSFCSTPAVSQSDP